MGKHLNIPHDAPRHCTKCGAFKDADEFHTRERGRRRRECRACWKKMCRDRASDGRYAHLAQNWQAKNPEKRKAHIAVGNAVRDGTLKKPNRCEDCGENGLIHGHHEDYSQPLKVDWLCTRCHTKRHNPDGR